MKQSRSRSRRRDPEGPGNQPARLLLDVVEELPLLLDDRRHLQEDLVEADELPLEVLHGGVALRDLLDRVHDLWEILWIDEQDGQAVFVCEFGATRRQGEEAVARGAQRR